MRYLILLLAFLMALFMVIVPNHKQDYYVLDCGSFNQNIYVFITEDTNMVRSYSKEMDFNSAACTVEGDVIIVWFPKYPDNGLLAHEMQHATYALFNSIGVPHTNDTDEVYAYQIQYLINKFGNIK